MAGNMNDMHAFRFGADGTAGPFDFVCTRAWLVIDQIATTNATVGGATVRLNRSTAAAPTVFNPAGDALATDTTGNIEYIAQIAALQKLFSVGDTMRVVVVNNAQADLFVEVVPTTWIAG